MKKVKTFIIITAVAGLLLGAQGLVQARGENHSGIGMQPYTGRSMTGINGSPCMGMMNGGMMGMGWLSAINLTQAQKVKMAKIRQGFRRGTLQTRSKLASLRVQLRTLFTQPDMDDRTLKAKHNEMLALQKELQEKRFAARLTMRKILTPEQLSMGMGRFGCQRGMMRSKRGMRQGKGHIN